MPNSIQTVVSIQWAPIQKHSEYANIHRCRRSGKIKHGLNVASLMLVVGRSKFSYCYNNNNIVGWMNQKKKTNQIITFYRNHRSNSTNSVQQTETELTQKYNERNCTEHRRPKCNGVRLMLSSIKSHSANGHCMCGSNAIRHSAS